jgi:hypothetical protein
MIESLRRIGGKLNVRYQRDRVALATTGAHLGPQVSRISVRLPRSVAVLAVAAWDREELGGVGEESREEYELREDAAELALIGLAITSNGVWDGEDVVDTGGAARLV